MQQFTIPQFIDVEDKIIGPITIRQFVILLVALMASVISYKLSDFVLFLTLTLFFFIFGGVLAFLKINGRPFHYFILNVVQTLKKPKLRIWNNKLGRKEKEMEEKETAAKQTAKFEKKPIYPKSKLAELSLVVDTGGVYQGGDDNIT
ncbi:hypothetical protein COT99_04340 [Candidatus Falkowbacteria bacterium CG10_big_fil_rev_8_21_14_0_10_43_10]|uniref:PrgI family protein n=1 Tax=Candidatus Falkowbacteria bacterium CG10_big_fil_rev_8_21_14_0_10_43_10 TaxID=1974567 RepID=A0A2H0V376_9BACT|nr:MAG: hypothetical protein COT99_04340 [Candidatus Falkowbacteria bacterium CG10_big_fil_rev_8_21_14_0_10_43_10]